MKYMVERLTVGETNKLSYTLVFPSSEGRWAKEICLIEFEKVKCGGKIASLSCKVDSIATRDGDTFARIYELEPTNERYSLIGSYRNGNPETESRPLEDKILRMIIDSDLPSEVKHAFGIKESDSQAQTS